MANEFIIKNGFRSQGNSEVTGSLNVTGGITGSLAGTAATASFAVTSSKSAIQILTTADTRSFALTMVESNTSSSLNNPAPIAIHTGAPLTYTVTGAGNTGILNATASYATQALSASFATTSSAANITDASDVNQQFHIAFVANTGSTQVIAADRDGLYNPKYNTLTVTASYATSAGTIFPYTGSAIISGSLGVTGTLNVITGSAIVLSTSTLTLTDKNSKSSVGWDKRNLFDAGGSLSADWTLRLLYDSQATTSASLDWKNRLLKNNAGTTILDWQNATFTGTASYATQALSASWAPGGSPGGSDTYIQFNKAGTFAGDPYFTYSIGSRSIAQGSANSAIGTYSHAEGESTVAQGLASHAEGYATTATGAGSHAEGESTKAYGHASHAEGVKTTTGDTSGYYTEMTASGVFTISSSYGDVSSAGLFTAGYIIGVDDSQYDDNYTYANVIVASCSFNGTNTIVHVTDTNFLTSTASIGSISNFGNGGDRVWGGRGAHAQGDSTLAQGLGSHAEGTGTAYGNYSHAEGASTAYGDFSHAEGASTAYGEYSHAEGEGAAWGGSSHAEGASTALGTYSHAEGTGIAGVLGFAMAIPITSGVIELDAKYGDQTAQFVAGGFVIIDDNQGEIVPGVATTYIYEISSSAFNGTPATEITLVDTSVNTASNKDRIGIYGNAQPTAADVPLGNASHAEGEATQTIGYSSHAAGYETRALGWYQSVVGQFNQPISQPSAFIVGDGVDDATRHNLLVAASSSVVISGSLVLTPTASGAPTSPGTDGQIIFGQASGNYKIYVWLGGAWRSGSLS